jgi:hypothetical protein
MMFMQDRNIVSARVWTGLAVIWLIWMAAPFLSGKEGRRGWTITVALGLGILIPTYSTLYSFAVWSIEGFAP